MSDPIPNQFWTLYDKVTGRVIKEHQATPGTADESLPVGLDQNLAWLVESSSPEPTFDPRTQRLEPSEAITIDTDDTSTGTRVFTFTAVGLSEEQLKDNQRQARLKRKAATVQAISEKFQNDEPVTVQEMGQVIGYIVDRDALDIAR